MKVNLRRIVSSIIIWIIFAVLPTYSQGGVLFQDNFDSHPDWSPKQKVYPDHTICKPDGTGECSGLPSGWSAFRIQGSPSSSVGHNTLELDSTNARGGSGKGMTVWCEGGGSDSTWWSDSLFTKTLDRPYNEIYIAFWIKFQSSYKFDAHPTDYIQKFFRAGHLAVSDYSTYPTQKPYNEPQGFLDLTKKDGTGGLSIKTAFRNHPNYYMDYSPHNVDTRYSVWSGSGSSGFQPSNLGDGKWHHWEFRYKLNSSTGAQNGVWEFWHDGNKLKSFSDIAWIESGGNMSRGFNFITIGGNVFNHFGNGEQWYAYDDVVISTERIGMNYVIGGGGGGGGEPPTVVLQSPDITRVSIQ